MNVAIMRLNGGWCNWYSESTTTYTPGNMKWVYLGQDENGKILLTSQEATSFVMNMAGVDAWEDGPARMDTLCNTLYGNSAFGTARNMKIEDVNRVLGYDGPLGSYYVHDDINYTNETVTTDEAITIGEICEKEGMVVENYWFDETNYLSNYYTYTGTDYIAATTNEYKVIFKKADGTTNQQFWLSSATQYPYITIQDVENIWYYINLDVRAVSAGKVKSMNLDATTALAAQESSNFLRPVIVLNSNIKLGAKNAAGAWTLVDM